MTQLIQTLGSFYEDNNDVKELTSVLELLDDQYKQETKETINALSRHDIDIFRKKLLYPVKVERTPEFLPYNGDGALYDMFGLYDTTTGKTKVELPAEVQSFEYWSDGITSDKKEYNSNIEVPEGVDTIWLHNAMIDQNDLYNHFGYVLDLELPSCEEYKLLINAIMDSLVNGPSEASIMLALSAMTGIPVAQNDNEKVLHIQGDLIETDMRTYQNGEPDRWTVQEGDILYKGQPLCDGIEITNDIPALQLGKEYTGMCDPITFINKDIPTHTTTVDGATMIDLDDDILTQLVHSRGVALAEKVTDPCELSRIRQIAGLEKPRPETVNTASGLGTYIITRRFN